MTVAEYAKVDTEIEGNALKEDRSCVNHLIYVDTVHPKLGALLMNARLSEGVNWTNQEFDRGERYGFGKKTGAAKS